MGVIQRFTAPAAKETFYTELAGNLWFKEAEPNQSSSDVFVRLVFVDQSSGNRLNDHAIRLRTADAFHEKGPVRRLHSVRLDMLDFVFSESRAVPPAQSSGTDQL